MKTYKLKNTIKAARYDGNNLADITSWIEDCGYDILDAYKADAYFSEFGIDIQREDLMDYTLYGQIGDFIIQLSNGSFAVLEEHIAKDLLEGLCLI